MLHQITIKKYKIMKFIKLTLSLNGSPSILVNISLCIDIYKNGDKPTQVSFGNDYYLSVIETPEEILKLINS